MMLRPLSQRTFRGHLTPAIRFVVRRTAFPDPVLPLHNQIAALTTLIDETAQRVAAAEAKLEGARPPREFETVPVLQQERIALLVKENQLREEKLILLRPGAGHTDPTETDLTGLHGGDSPESARLASELKDVHASVRKIKQELRDCIASHSQQSRSKEDIETALVTVAQDEKASNLVHAERSVVGKAATKQLGAQKAADCAGDPLLIRIKELEKEHQELKDTQGMIVADHLSICTTALLVALSVGLLVYFCFAFSQAPPLVVFVLLGCFIHIFILCR